MYQLLAGLVVTETPSGVCGNQATLMRSNVMRIVILAVVALNVAGCSVSMGHTADFQGKLQSPHVTDSRNVLTKYGFRDESPYRKY